MTKLNSWTRQFVPVVNLALVGGVCVLVATTVAVYANKYYEKQYERRYALMIRDNCELQRIILSMKFPTLTPEKSCKQRFP